MNRTEKIEKNRIYRQIIPCLLRITQGKAAVIFMTTLLLFVFASHGYPSSQMSDSKTLELREKYRKMQEYDIKLEKEGYKNGYVRAMLGSEKNNIFFVSLKGTKETSNLFDHSGGGLWVSNDKAKSWQKSMTGIKDVKEPVYHLVEDEQRGRFYIATENGAYRSDDKARTWQRFSEGHPYEHRDDDVITPAYYKLSLDPDSGDVYSRVPLDGFGIYKTGCKTPNWMPIGHSLPADSITIDVAFSPADKSVYILNGNSGVIIIGGFDSRSMGVYKGFPREKGYEWVKEKIPVESKDYEVIRSIDTDPNTGILYASTASGLFKKVNGQWAKDLNAIYVSAVVIEKGNQQRAVAVTAERLFIKDKGTWLPIKNTPWNKLAMVRDATFYKGGLFIATNEGLFVSWDNTKSWEMIKLPGAS